jgi:hypothetical protein
MEYLIGGIGGLVIGILIAQWAHYFELEYKARTGIDMCIRGKFYTVRRHLKRESR